MKVVPPLKIFLVDSNLFCLKMYELHLGVLGYKEIRLYQDGQTCLDDLTDRPDVIFLDHRIDTINDPLILKKIKQFNPDIYVIFLCGPESVEETRESLKYGAFDYIVKDENDLDDMKRMLGKIKTIKELLSSTERNFVRKIL